jgi:hypothetical protein
MALALCAITDTLWNKKAVYYIVIIFFIIFFNYPGTTFIIKVKLY